MNKYMPYILPVVSILAIGGFLLFNPSITGFAVQENEVVPYIKISTEEGLVMPVYANVRVGVDGAYRDLSLNDFITKSGAEYNLAKGKFTRIDYEGVGYTGNYDYRLGLEEVGFENLNLSGGEKITIDITYEGKLISHSEALVPSN